MHVEFFIYIKWSIYLREIIPVFSHKRSVWFPIPLAHIFTIWPNDHCLYQIPSTTYNTKNMKKIYHIYSVSRFKYLVDWHNISIPLELFLLVTLIPPHDDVTKTFSSLLALFAGNSTVSGEFPSQRPVTLRFDVFFDARLNKELGKQSRRRWFETPSRSL